MEKKNFENNAMKMNVLLCEITKYNFVKFMHYTSAKEILDKLFNAYHGDVKVRNAKIQTWDCF